MEGENIDISRVIRRDRIELDAETVKGLKALAALAELGNTTVSELEKQLLFDNSINIPIPQCTKSMNVTLLGGGGGGGSIGVGSVNVAGFGGGSGYLITSIFPAEALAASTAIKLILGAGGNEGENGKLTSLEIIPLDGPVLFKLVAPGGASGTQKESDSHLRGASGMNGKGSSGGGGTVKVLIGGSEYGIGMVGGDGQPGMPPGQPPNTITDGRSGDGGGVNPGKGFPSIGPTIHSTYADSGGGGAGPPPMIVPGVGNGFGGDGGHFLEVVGDPGVGHRVQGGNGKMGGGGGGAGIREDFNLDTDLGRVIRTTFAGKGGNGIAIIQFIQ